MSQTQQGKTGGRDQAATPFAHWLDAMIPAKFRNDAEFARQLGVRQAYVFRWRRGVRPQLPMLLKISKLTGTSVETLAEIAGYQAPRGGAS
jgi:transcriptional regulator with XRE-family HTH domain